MITGTQVYQAMQHPLFILIAGAIITYVIAPQLIKIWQANEKRTELKYDIAEQITDSVLKMLLAIELFNTHRDNAINNAETEESVEEYSRIAMKPAVVDEIKGVAEWEESRQKIAIRLQLYFSKSDIEKQWEDFCKKMRVYEERIISKSDAGPTKEDILTDNKVLKPSLHPSINTESRHLSRIK